MSLDEFCGYYFDEFEAICKAWAEREENLRRDRWERTRMLASITIQPHITKRITPHQLMPLPWDKEEERHDAPKISAEEQKKRFEKLVHQLGDEIYGRQQHDLTNV